MKTYSIVILIVFMGLLFNLTAQTAAYNNVDFSDIKIKSDFINYLVKNFSTNAYAIVNHSKAPSDNTQWINGNTHKDILRGYGTIVHETCHTLNFKIGEAAKGYGYFISPDIELAVPKSEVYKSSEIDKTIPDEWKKNIFRYKTYLQGEDGIREISSIKEGIYGMMDEFDSYYQDTRAMVELYDYYKIFAKKSEPDEWIEYLSNCYSIVYAYYEFKLFMAWYLKYAKKNHITIYNKIIQNKNLKAVYTLLDKAYQKAIEQYFANRETIVTSINSLTDKKVELSDNYLYIKTSAAKTSTSVGFGIPDGQIKYLKSLYTNEDNQMLKLLTIENLDEINYKTFLE